MQIVSEHEIKEELSKFVQKVPAFSGRHYPIEYLNSREFELLSYFLFKKDIELGLSNKVFDTVRLMKGTSDRGRDLLLQNGSTNVGVVQCKRYESLITKPGLAREVIKFVLHVILDKTLISDIANFTYYFVALKGFNETATKFLSNFNIESIDELNLRPWTNEVIAENEFFKGLKYEEVNIELCSILSLINIEPITGDDLDLKLKKSKDIVSIFFEVEKVASEDMLRKVLEEVTGFKNDEDMEKLRQKLQDIPSDKRLYGGLFELYGYDEDFYRKILKEKEVVYMIAELKSEINNKFIDYLQDSIHKLILVYITGMGNISAFTKSLMQPYLFNKYGLKYQTSKMGVLSAKLDEGKQETSLYKYQTLEEHKNYSLEIGKMVLDNDFSSFFGEGELLRLKIELANFTYGKYSSTDEMQKRFESDMKILQPVLDTVEKEIENIMPTNPTLIIGSGGIGETEEDLLNLFKKLQKFG